MNFWTALHWLAFAAVFTFAVSTLFYVCREIGAWWRASK